MRQSTEDGEEQWGSWSGGGDSSGDSGGDSRFVDSRAVQTGGAAARP